MSRTFHDVARRPYAEPPHVRAEREADEADYVAPYHERCESCDGTGDVAGERCLNCDGGGTYWWPPLPIRVVRAGRVVQLAYGEAGYFPE